MRMVSTHTSARLILGTALSIALLPQVAFASPQIDGLSQTDQGQIQTARAQTAQLQTASEKSVKEHMLMWAENVLGRPVQPTDFALSYDPADLAAIGCQQKSGHTICCPSYACAYADAVLDGTVHDHSYYTCSNCSWTDWGGGNSSFRSVGTSEQLLREAYDQITAGKPTVIHVRASYGEHWIALIGYQDAIDPDHLTLANFIALDPWDGSEVNAGAAFSLYGDGCEHISSRA